ncbi:MAG TPA: class I SAM-dependent methyltransferase [Thermoanaerobaculia bacterium]|jgi:2-polyprenyl-3-methyl-5-hydroxy-6-metoxy-1,4-benzoquinol methylase
MTDQLRRSWLTNAAAWTEAVREQRIASRQLGTDAAIVAAVLDRSPRDVLDLGCGEGWLTRALAAQGMTVTGVDVSPALIEAAHALGGGTFQTLPYDELDTLTATFDVIVANFSLFEEQLPDVRPLLNPGGAFIIQTLHPAFAGPPYADGWRVETFATLPGFTEEMPWYFRTLGSWVRALADAGLRLEELREPLHPETGVPLSVIFCSTVQQR